MRRADIAVLAGIVLASSAVLAEAPRTYRSETATIIVGGMPAAGAVAREFAPSRLAVVSDISSTRLDAVRSVAAFIDVIEDAARLTAVDAALIRAVIDVESGANPAAVSPKGATGLMQLMPATGSRYGARDLFDVRQNVMAGSRYLSALLNQFGDLPLALAAYNAGENAVRRHGGRIPPYPETETYVSRVLARYARHNADAQR